MKCLTIVLCITFCSIVDAASSVGQLMGTWKLQSEVDKPDGETHIVTSSTWTVIKGAEKHQMPFHFRGFSTPNTVAFNDLVKGEGYSCVLSDDGKNCERFVAQAFSANPKLADSKGRVGLIFLKKIKDDPDEAKKAKELEKTAVAEGIKLRDERNRNSRIKDFWLEERAKLIKRFELTEDDISKAQLIKED
jgi:hypothetical protein